MKSIALGALSAVPIVLAAPVAGQVQLALQQVGAPADFLYPIGVAQPPGETRRLYVVGHSGPIWVVRDGVRLAVPFLDLTSFITGGGLGEAGVLGLAFHPQFQSNGYFYVSYSRSASPTGTAIVRYTTNPAAPDTANPSSATPVLFIPRPTGIHNGGWLGFGPDGYLYNSVGEAGTSTNAQQLNTLLGKMLRIDVDRDDFPADPARNYGIPTSNPFFGSTTTPPEIWSVGLRNPWRCSFDRMTGDLWIGDVGQGTSGEIDFQAAASPPIPVRNYGWACMEGNTCLGSAGGCTCNAPTLTGPVFDLGRPAGTIAITGGYVYRGAAIPGFAGSYVFADYGGQVWSFRYNGSNITEFTSQSGAITSRPWAGFGEDNAGEMYLCSLNSGNTGAVYKIVALAACYANCDGSTIPPALNINDFICFFNRYSAGDSYANCDGSTIPPVLNVNDFTCFTNAYASSCH